MDIMELGAIGELVGGVAVIGSLVFVGVQIRHNTKAQNAAAVDQAVEKMMSVNNLVAADADVARFVVEASIDFASLQVPDNLRAHAIMRSSFIQFDLLRVKREAGLVHDSLWHIERAVFADIVAQPGYWYWWERNAKQFSPEYRDFIAELRREVVPPEPASPGGTEA